MGDDMSRWFRFYSDAMRHPKVAKLTDAEFRLWVELLAVASDNDGLIPPLSDLKHVLKRRLDHLSRGLEGLLRASLIDPLEVGYEPHGWSKRQYKSDTSTDRVKKFREKRNVSETPPETEPDTDTDTERKEPKGSSASGDAPLAVDEVLEGWNILAAKHGLSQVRKLTDQRRRKVTAQARRFPVPDWQSVFGKISQSPFLRGENRQGWRCDFDFILSEGNFVKILEGKYDQQ